jgi:hypothetical protein
LKRCNRLVPTLLGLAWHTSCLSFGWTDCAVDYPDEIVPAIAAITKCGLRVVTWYRRLNPSRLLIPAVICLLVSGPGRAAGPGQSASPRDEPLTALWKPPEDLPARDLFNGPWGAANAPDPHAQFQFVRPKKRGASPGMILKDPAGRIWHVKQGREASPEVVVSRILSAVGYHQPPVYFVHSFTFETASGVATGKAGRFRVTRSDFKSGEPWSWAANPFIGTAPYQGLLVMLVLLNDADLKTSNNRIYTVTDQRGNASRRYIVRDLGTSFGETGRFAPDGNKLDRFERHPFITGVANGYVKFDYPAVNNSAVHRITVDDVRWACGWLAQLSLRQWRDAFRAGGYAPDVADRFIKRIREKIAEGQRLR